MQKSILLICTVLLLSACISKNSPSKPASVIPTPPASDTEINKEATSPDGTKKAYIIAKKPQLLEDNTSYSVSKPFAVNLEAGNTSSTILSYPYRDPEDEFGLNDESLRDISFSPDSNILVITTSSEIFLYQNNKISTVYIKDKSDEATHRDYSYERPVFSPNMRKIIIEIGRYEGSTYAVLDLDTSKFIRLPYHAYVSGTTVEWYDNDSLLTSTYDPSDPKFISVTSIVSLPSLETLWSRQGKFCGLTRSDASPSVCLEVNNQKTQTIPFPAQ